MSLKISQIYLQYYQEWHISFTFSLLNIKNDAFSFLNLLAERTQVYRQNKIQNNIFMGEHTTYSLSTILNTNHLQPQIYHHMIQQIKSPLQEQSFDLTQDDSRSFEKIPKRPNIPPPPPKSPIKHYNDQFSRTYDSIFLDPQQSRNKQYDPIVEEAFNSVVSPLQYEVNVKKTQPSGPAVWCGNQLDKVLRVEDVQDEFQLPFRNSNYKRKPIFQKKIVQSQKPLVPMMKAEKSIEEIINSLQKDKPELASFLELMDKLQKELRQIDSQKHEMQSNLSLIYEKLSTETDYAAQVSESNDTHSRILRRLHSRNTGEVVRKILGRNKKKQLEGEKHLEKLFTRLNNVQILITEYIQRQNSLDKIGKVFKEINYLDESTFVNQLRKLYSSLGIFIETKGLELIWQNCHERTLNKIQFVEGLSLNTFIVREENNFEQDLYMKGFQRNDDL